MNGRSAVSFCRAVYDKWRQDNVPQLAAALAYYTAFSFTPLLVILVAVVGMVLGRQTVKEHLLGQVQDMFGVRGAQIIQTAMSSITQLFSGVVATAISGTVLLFGASRVFAQLQTALDIIWKVQPESRRVADTVKHRTGAFLVVLAAGFLLFASLVVNAVVATLIRYFDSYLPGGNLAWRLVDFAVSFAMLTATFAMIYRILPRTKIAWRDVWAGAAVATLLFSIVRYLLAFYLRRGAFTSVYGAAGSFFVILFWFYCATHILLLGAECTQVYATRYGSQAPSEPR